MSDESIEELYEKMCKTDVILKQAFADYERLKRIMLMRKQRTNAQFNCHNDQVDDDDNDQLTIKHQIHDYHNHLSNINRLTKNHKATEKFLQNLHLKNQHIVCTINSTFKKKS